MMDPQMIETLKDLLTEDQMKYVRDDVRFAILKITSCNGMDNVSFSQSKISFDPLTEGKDTLYVTLEQMFRHGISVLEDVRNGKKIEETSTYAALVHLCEYYKSKETNASSLKKVFGNGKPSETAITVALSEHLLKPLSPGQFSILDSTMNGRDKCQCGCMKEDLNKYGNTSIGNKDVWHGTLDIILGLPEKGSSTEDIERDMVDMNIHEGTEDIASGGTAPKKTSLKKEKQLVSSSKQNSGKLTDELSIAEVKIEYTESRLMQALAQIIVFSCQQKKNHPAIFSNLMVPNIIITPNRFQVIMYDVQKDLLICSRSIELFDSENNLECKAIVVIWMVLHYRLFCTGFNDVDKDVIERCRSDCPLHVGEKWDTHYINDPVGSSPRYNTYPKIDENLTNGKKLNLKKIGHRKTVHPLAK